MRSFAATWALVAVSAYAAWGVVAVGRAPLTGDGAADRERALDDARRRAVAAAVGVYVNSAVLVKNQLLVDDTVLTRAAGFVKNETVTSEGERDGFYVVTISCDVEESLVATELDRLKRAVVVAIDDEGRGIEEAVREGLVSAGLECLDEAFLEGAGRDVVFEDVGSFTGGRLADLGRRYLARFILYGEVKVEDAGRVSDEPLPYVGDNPFAGYYVAEARGAVRVIDTADGRVVSERCLGPGEVRGFGVDAAGARRDAAANAGAALGEYLARVLISP